MLKVLIADDQALMRDGLQTILQLEDDIEVIATAENGEEACRLVGVHDPDLVLMDIRMPVMSGIEAVKKLRAESPHTKVLVLTTFDEDEYIIEALAGGAVGFLLKDIPTEKLLQAIRDAAQGEIMLPSAIAVKLAARLASPSPAAGKAPAARSRGRTADLKFTNREMSIIALMVEGRTNKEIAQLLFMSEGTVKNYISAIYDKIGTNDRTQAVIWLKDMTII
ncbi:DNA-binding response regulator [Cohnella sp. CIP 111063]|uniref:response regulator transcription factor n=1 Tax=unclassified Cohnella TaxID=2636738 RepID=UPI000B8C4B2C|nr:MULTISPECIES: response regulator transcription factor [unclassified Cohnella]OXS53569.1 DNA-binding response regulator [Cohnella sp. CIP 111063]PRX61599.1 LuxR family two component transcriptional regulator [Cohnella sp. SGD-V74]